MQNRRKILLASAQFGLVLGSGLGLTACASKANNSRNSYAERNLHALHNDKQYDLLMEYFRDQFLAIEQNIGGRLGVTLVSSDGEVGISYRGKERFAMCSTFKAPLAAALFDAAKRGLVDIYKPNVLKQEDLVPYAPFVEAQLAAKQKATLKELAKAALQSSDNAAANLVLKAIGGPPAFTRFVRSHGDVTTRLDRIEPYLNENASGDKRDTTSPEAMARLMQKTFIGEEEIKYMFDDPSDIRTLQEWMEGSTTGANRIRAGLLPRWPVGNKTGTAPDGSAYNDVAIIWPHGNREYRASPVILAVYVDRPTASAAEVEAAIAAIAKLFIPFIGSPE